MDPYYMDMIEHWLRQDVLTRAQVSRAEEYARKNHVCILEALILLAYLTPTQVRTAREKTQADPSGCRIFYRNREFHLFEKTAIVER